MTEPLSVERLAQIRECANGFGRWLDGHRVLALDLLHEIDRLRAANDQLAQLLADRDQREDTLNDDTATTCG